MFANCPHCGESWDAGSIFDNFVAQRAAGNDYWKDKSDEEIQEKIEECYSAPYRFSKLSFVSINDKLSYYCCPFCDTKISGQVTHKFPANEEELAKAE